MEKRIVFVKYFFGRLVTNLYILWLIVFIVATVNFFLMLNNESKNHYLSFYIWIINIILFAIALKRIHFNHIIKGKAAVITVKNKRFTVIFGILILFVSFFLRVFFLESVPANVGGDEMSQAMKSYEFAVGKRSDIFSPNEWYGSPNFYFFVMSFIFRFMGKSVWIWRFGSVIIGSFTVFLSYKLFSELFGNRVGMFSSILLAFFHLHVNFSRLGAHQITDPFWVVLISIFFFKAFKKNSILFYGLTGVLLAVSQNFYFGARIIPLLLSFIFIIISIDKVRNKKFEVVIKSLATLVSGFILGFYPFLSQYLIFKDMYLSRFKQTAMFSSGGALQVLEKFNEQDLLRSNISKTLHAFTDSTTTQWYIPNYPLVNKIAIWFFLIGLLLRVNLNISH